MLRLARLTLREIDLPLKEPFQTASGIATKRRILLLHLKDINGIESWSECVAGSYPNYSPETIDTAWFAIKEWIAPKVLGREFQMPDEIHPILERDIRGHLMAKAAVEMGMWELAAQIQGKSLSKFLGGTKTKIATGISLGIQKSPQVLIEKIQQALKLGYQRVKIKIKPGADVEYLAAVRAAVGGEASLTVDANCAYSLEDIEHLRQLDQFNLKMIEQPLAWDDLVQHAVLQKEIKTPICLDESINTLAKTKEMVALASGRIVNIKPGRVGGFTSSIGIHDYCKQNDIPVWCGGMLESGIGRAYNVALASLQNFVLPGDISPSSRYWQQDIVTPEWTMDSDGMVTVPLERTGIGVDVNQDRIENLTIRRETLKK